MVSEINSSGIFITNLDLKGCTTGVLWGNITLTREVQTAGGPKRRKYYRD